jgi:tetratricopeptide (TPR) repeat protein
LNNLAVTLDSQERHEEAAALHREALEMRKATLGDQHPLVANSMINLAVVLDTTGDFAGAEALDRQALDITRSALGPDHARVAQILANLGRNLGYQDRLVEGQRAHEESLRIRRKVFGARSREAAESLNALGWNLKSQHKLAAAEPLLRESIDVAVQAYGEKTVETAEARAALASLVCEKHASVDAISLFGTSVAFFDANGGKYELPAAITRGNYGECLTSLGRYDEAEPQLTQSYARLIKLGTSHKWAQLATRRLADLYHRWGDVAEENRYRGMLSTTLSKP